MWKWRTDGGTKEIVSTDALVCCLSAAVSLQEATTAVDPAEKLPLEVVKIPIYRGSHSLMAPPVC